MLNEVELWDWADRALDDARWLRLQVVDKPVAQGFTWPADVADLATEIGARPPPDDPSS